MSTATIDVKGMTCSGCVNAVTRALTSVPGVQDTEVSLEKNQATVKYDDGKVSVDDLKKAIEDAGYDV